MELRAGACYVEEVHNKEASMDGDQEEGLEGARYLAFQLGDERYGVEIRKVREIIEVGKLTTLPLAPQHVRGVINLRGVVVPVIDLATRMGRADGNAADRSCVIIIETMRRRGLQATGLLVDGVSEVLALAPEDIEPSPVGSSGEGDIVLGIGKLPDGFLVLIDIDAVLGEEQSLAA
jgi:purine-binding chemotaxis protein CheW